MATAFEGDDDFDSLSKAQWIDRVCDRFELAWNSSTPPEIDHYLIDVPDSIRRSLLLELVGIDIEYRRRLENSLPAQDYLNRYPDLSMEMLKPFLEKTIELKADRSADPLEREKVPIVRDSSYRTIHYFGDYELLEKRARGGMGTVYRARQISLNRIVAIKTINSGQFASTEEIKRFYCEAEAAASLDHPQIVPVYEVGEFQGDHFYSMAYVEGRSLAAKLLEGPMEPREAAGLLLTVAKAIQYAHQQGVIHRDLKPSNILLDLNGQPRVTDFGLAKRMMEGTGITLSGEILGTPCYMPPEQAAGKINAVGYPSDVYSLGAVLYNCLSGRPPFQAANHVATLRQVIDSEPVALRLLNPAVPRDLETITHKCLEKSMTQRYLSPHALAEDLDRYLSGLPIYARPIGPIERGWRWCRRHPAQTMNAVAVLLLLFGAFSGWAFVRAREKEITAIEAAKVQVGELNSAQDAELSLSASQVWQNPRTIPFLHEQFEKEAVGTRLRSRAAIGLLHRHPIAIDELCEAWLSSSWTEWNWLSEQLLPHRDSILPWIEDSFSGLEAETNDARFVRLIAIKSVLLKGEGDSIAWAEDMDQSVVERVVGVLMGDLRRDPENFRQVSKAIMRIRGRLAPTLARYSHHARKDGGPDAPIAARLLAEMFEKEPSRLVEFGWSARSDLFSVLFDKCSDKIALRNEMLVILKSVPRGETWDERVNEDRKRALAGAVLYSLGEFDIVWPLLTHTRNGSIRSLLIEWIPVIQPDSTALIGKLREELQKRVRHVEQTMAVASLANQSPNPWLFDSDSSQFRALINILGGYPPLQINRQVDSSFWSKLLEFYEQDPDPGVHASIAWVLKKMNFHSQLEEVEARLVKQRPNRTGWFVAANGHTMVSLKGPIEFVAGADEQDPYRTAGDPKDPKTGEIKSWSEDHRHPKQINRSFAIALHETSLKQLDAMDPNFHSTHNITLGPTMEHPVSRVSWHRAAEYCNYLSEIEGLDKDQYCFLEIASEGSNPTASPLKEYKLAPNYLERTGYRLPTEAEWEYACRAGTETRWYLGNSDELLMKHVWFIRNSEEKQLLVPGTLSPNELGLFETLGNVLEWCMDPFEVSNPATRFAKADSEKTARIQSHRILRGGSLYSMHYALRASEYYQDPPSYRDGHFGFRIARSLPLQ